MRNSFVSLIWLAVCIFYLTLRSGAINLPDEFVETIDGPPIERDVIEKPQPEVSKDPPSRTPLEYEDHKSDVERTVPVVKISPRVAEALRVLRPFKIKYRRTNAYDKSSGILGKTLYYGKELFTLLFMNNVPTDPTSPRKLSKPLAHATSLLKSAALENDPDAIFLLAEMNFFGNYTYPRNYTEAFVRYHQLATLNGNRTAQHMTGFFYATGYGNAVERDQAKALLYHTFAAQAGDTRSEMTAGYRHHNGIATPRNCDRATHFYKRAADKAIAFSRTGPPGGQALQRDAHRIADENGGVYGEGASVVSSGVYANRAGPNSDAHAAFDDVLEYLDLMSRKGDLKATFSLGRLHYEGSRSMRRNLRTARAYFMTVARKYWQRDGTVKEEDNHVAKIASKAAGYIGRMFLRGEGMEQDFEKALVWFRRGVKNGDALCQYELGVMYLHGLGVRKDPLLSGDYFRASAEQDFASAEVNMGKLFLDQGNVPEATRYFDLAARHHHIEAFYHLAEINNNGIGRDRSCNMATAYYKMVAEKVETIHSSFDEANLAYDNGDIETALALYMLAAEQGYESAQANVAYILDTHKSILSLSSLLPKSLQRSPSSTLPAYLRNAVLALIYWTRSARQANIDSMVKMGDYYLRGLPSPSSSSSSSSPSLNTSTSPLLLPDNEKAATCYQTAAETHQSAQALWNLGWIHENGVGVVQDFHLAKRFYDEALETNQESYLPVKLALMKLRWRSWWSGVLGEEVNLIKDEPDPPTSPQSWRQFFHSLLNDPDGAHPYYHGEGDHDGEDYLDHDAAGVPDIDARDRRDIGAGAREGRGGLAGGRERDGGAGEGEDEFADLYDRIESNVLESAIIVALTGVLAWLVWYRNNRAREANTTQTQAQITGETAGMDRRTGRSVHPGQASGHEGGGIVIGGDVLNAQGAAHGDSQTPNGQPTPYMAHAQAQASAIAQAQAQAQAVALAEEVRAQAERGGRERQPRVEDGEEE